MTQKSKNIDEIMKDRFQDFGSVPSAKVWEDLNDHLDNKSKKRKLVLFSIITGVLLIGGGSTYLALNGNSSEQAFVDPHLVESVNEIKDVKKGSNPVTAEVSTPDEIEVSEEAPTVDRASEQPVISPENAEPVLEEVPVVIEEEVTETAEEVEEIEVVRADHKKPELDVAEVKEVEEVFEKNDTITFSLYYDNPNRKMARKIKIIETLPEYFDVKSIQPLKSPHDFSYDIKKKKNAVVWVIKEVPAKRNGSKSWKGYIDYDIVVVKKAKKSLLKSKKEKWYDIGYGYEKIQE